MQKGCYIINHINIMVAKGLLFVSFNVIDSGEII